MQNSTDLFVIFQTPKGLKIMSSGRRLSGLGPLHSRENSRQMRLEDHLTDDDGIEDTEISVEVSHVVRGSSITNQLPASGDRPMIDLYVDEFADQTAIGRAITEILHFRYIEPWPAWGAVPQDKKDQIWLRFKLELEPKNFIEKNPEVPFDKDYTRLTHFNPTWMKQELWIALLNVFNSENWKALSEQNKKNRNTSVGGVHTCGSRSFTNPRKVHCTISLIYPKKVTKGLMGSTKFYTYAHTLKATRPPLVQQSDGLAGVDGSVGEGESNRVGRSDGTDGSIRRGITHGAGTSSDPIFVLTGIPSTPHAATSNPPDAVMDNAKISRNSQNLDQTRDTGKG
ncbi:hypothetical protein Tco_0153484 [Tanacetum coccineum]